MTADPLWHLDGVFLDPERLDNVSLSIGRGVTAVIGWSGAGKTSLLNLLVGFEKPTRGKLTAPPRIAWVPQNGGLWPQCDSVEHLHLAGASREAIAELLAAFDLENKAGHRPHELSQGEKSRLAVARALAMGATVLVMDEPLVHVDPARAPKYWTVIREHLRTHQASLVFSTHIAETVLGEATRAICLREGRVLHEGRVQELYDAPPTAELMTFLGAGNWVPVDASALWLKLEEPRCIRPEQLQIRAAADGEFVVESARWMGSLAECELRHEPSGQRRVFFHRPADRRLENGIRVTLTVQGNDA